MAECDWARSNLGSGRALKPVDDTNTSTEQTARAALTLLDDAQKHVCVLCDWHDDYVIEAGDPPTRYIFHQVKTRNSSQGPWTFQQFFGVKKKKAATPAKEPPTIGDDAIAPLMLLHHRNFAESCAGVAFVTNSGIHPDLEKFLTQLRQAQTLTDLTGEARIAFDHIAHAYLGAQEPLASSADDLFLWLRGLHDPYRSGQPHARGPRPD